MTSDDAHRGSRQRARWMAQAQDGDAEAYRALLNDIGPVVMAFLRRRVRDADEAQDLYQEIFMILHRARHSYEPSRPLEPWLFAIARRVVADHRSRRRAREAREILVQGVPEVSTEGYGQLKPQLEQALRRLSPDQRQAIALLKIDGLPTAAAAALVGTTPGALRVRAHRAFRMLRQFI
jgi:RNA polymerase sigma-70 factor, ECF subfamily